MRIAIIGAGNVGGSLGRALVSAGHEVMFGVRNPESAKSRAAVEAAPGSTVGTPAEAVAAAEVVVFALRPDAVPETVAALPSLEGRVVIDAMNRISGAPGSSTSEDLLELMPGARIVKAFNTIGFENLATARQRRVRAAMFVAGDDQEAKAVALDLASQLGFQAEDAGPISNAGALEGMVKVWLALTQRHGRSVGFALSDG